MFIYNTVKKYSQTQLRRVGLLPRPHVVLREVDLCGREACLAVAKLAEAVVAPIAQNATHVESLLLSG